MHGASEQCMHATEIDFSAPTTPSLMVTTRRRFTPHGTSFSFLQAVTQPLHSMQRPASHRNFILAGRRHPHPLAVADAAVGRGLRVDLAEAVLLQLGEPRVGARLVAAALVLDQAAAREHERELLRHLVLDGLL